MSQDELNSLMLEEQEMAQRLEELRQRRFALQQEENARLAAELREKELSKPLTVTVSGVLEWADDLRVVTQSPYREDVVALMRTFRTRNYSGGRENSFSITEWNDVAEKLVTLKNVTIEYNPGVEDRVKKGVAAPNWLVEIGERWLYATPSKFTRRYMLQSITGAKWDTTKQRYEIPLTEAHTLWVRLEKEEKVEWSEQAMEFVVKVLARRAALDQIAKLPQDDTYMALDLNGNKLMPFQSTGAAFIEAAEGKAVLGDEMGLGKTWQAIAYAQKQQFKKVVVIAPASLKPNWFREILRLTGERARVLYGATPSRYDLVDIVAQDSEHRWFIINYDIISRVTMVPEETIVTDKGERITRPEYEKFLWADVLSMANADLVIVDEGHYIKNVDSNRSQAIRGMKAQRWLFMTGTPVLNRPGELWPMLTKVAPEQFPSYETFLHQYTYDDKTARNVEDLRKVLAGIMIRRLKKDIYQDLPAIVRVPTFHELSPKAYKLYQKVLAGIYELIDDYYPGRAGDSWKVTNILVQIGRLKQIAAIDKTERTAELALELYEQTDESEHRKVIIFSQYKGAAYKIARLLGHEALSFVSRRGSEFVTADANERDRLVQQFQTDDSIKFLVATEKTTKEGHNITAAGHVIFNDLFWTPAGHDQAIGRAYGRLSDMHGVDAYFLIGTLPNGGGESIEEWIWQLLNFKQGVIDEVVEGVEGSRDSSIAMMLIEKVREAMLGARGK